MTWWQTVLLGLVQGLTEFLPISSSAHLALVPYWLGWQLPPTESFLFNVLVQVATLVAVISYYRVPLTQMARHLTQDLRQRQGLSPESRLALWLLVASVPAAVAGLVLKEAVAQTFTQPRHVALFLVLTGALMALAEVGGRQQRTMQALTWQDALTIGVFQALALFPGVSRSGATLSGGMLRHLRREDAAHFAFLLAVPIMLGAGFITLLDLFRLPGEVVRTLFGPYLLGFAVAALSGYMAIRFLLQHLRKRSLWPFVVYCWALALVTWWRV